MASVIDMLKREGSSEMPAVQVVRPKALVRDVSSFGSWRRKGGVRQGRGRRKEMVKGKGD